MDVVIPVTTARISRGRTYRARAGEITAGRNLSVTLLTTEIIGCTVIISPFSQLAGGSREGISRERKEAGIAEAVINAGARKP